MPRVLWAEDHPDDRELIQAVLETTPDAPQVRFVHHGKALLQELPVQQPDLVVLDLKMPVMGGIEALEHMRQDPRWRSTPVVIFSSSRQMHEVAACNALGAARFVQKPIAFDALAEAVQTVLAPAVQA